MFKENLFITKYNSSGNVVWAKNKDHARVADISCDGSGNSYLLGTYRDSIVFGSDKLKYPFYGNFFLAKYDVNGNDMWGKDGSLVKAQSGNNFIMPHSIAKKISVDIYIGGGFDCKRINFDSYQITNNDTTGNSRGIFVARTSANFVGLQELTAYNTFPKIYPNPFNEQLILESSDSGGKTEQIVFYDKMGQLFCLPWPDERGKIKINTESLSSGVYFVRYKSVSLVRVFKIIKY